MLITGPICFTQKHNYGFILHFIVLIKITCCCQIIHEKNISNSIKKAIESCIILYSAFFHRIYLKAFTVLLY